MVGVWLEDSSAPLRWKGEMVLLGQVVEKVALERDGRVLKAATTLDRDMVFWWGEYGRENEVCWLEAKE